MGPVEDGVRTSFTEWGILEPTSAYECLAIFLAQVIDGTNETYKAVQDKTGISSISRQLVAVLEKIEDQANLRSGERDEIADKY